MIAIIFWILAYCLQWCDLCVGCHAGLEVPGFFATASKQSKAKPLGEAEQPAPAPKQQPLRKGGKKVLRHAHLGLMQPPVTEDEPMTQKEPMIVPEYYPPPAKASKYPQESLSQEESWARLAEMNPCKGKKRKTVHKPRCGCFLCAKKPRTTDQSKV